MTLEKLQDENKELHSTLVQKEETILDLETTILDLETTILDLKEQLAWLKRHVFGKRSEKCLSELNSEQLTFEGFEMLDTENKEPQSIAGHQRQKPQRNGQDSIKLSPDLPVKTVVLDIPEEEKICKETGTPLVQIGTEVTHKLAHEPGSYYIKEIIRPKYAHPQRPEDGIVNAFLPDSIISRCRADDSLLAEIITKKFSDHLPLYRMAEGMGREGVIISRKLLSQWVLRCGIALKPLYEEMKKQVLNSKTIFIDESPVKLQAKDKCKTAFMWVVVGGNESNPAYRIYDFRENRCHHNVLDILKDYKNILHSDKYAAYQRLAEKKIITWCPCWAHIRRKFFEAESGDPPFRKWILRKIRYLFMLERIAWARSAEERLRIRQEKEAPIIEELQQRITKRLAEGRLLPKSKFREALGYFCSLAPYLKNYTKHPFARLDNNMAERAVRPLAIGRKNWLFFGSPDGGEAGSILLSFVQTCRGLGINPRTYLEDVFRRLMGHNSQKLHELLPDQWLLAQKSPQSN